MKKYSSLKVLNKARLFEYLANSQLKVANKKNLYKLAQVDPVTIFIAMLVVPIIAQAIREHNAKAESLKEAVEKFISELDDIKERFESPYKQTMKDTGKGFFVVGPGALLGAGWKAYQLNKEYPKYEKRFEKFKSDITSLLKAYNNLLKCAEEAKQNKNPEMQNKMLSHIAEYDNYLRKVSIGIPIIVNAITELKGIVDKVIDQASFEILQSDFKDVIVALTPLNAKISETIESVDEMKENINNAIKKAQEEAMKKAQTSTTTQLPDQSQKPSTTSSKSGTEDII